MKIKTYLIITLLVFFCNESFSQQKDGDGFTRFYYQSGNLSSEGFIENGKANGYWKNYYENGTLKSEGNRVNFLLDSTWIFYNIDGNISKKINYREDKKNGYSYTYSFYYDKDSIKHYYLKSKELFYLDKKEGLSYFFDSANILINSINYKNDKRHGYAKTYNKDSIVIVLRTYFNGYQLNLQKINRYNNDKLKQGLWIDFHQNGNKHRERYYSNDSLHGSYKEYDLSEKLIKEITYVKGSVYIPPEKEAIKLKSELRTEYFENGNIKYEGAFLNNNSVGIHKEYNENGQITISKEYSQTGKLLGQGFFDKNGLKTGKWKLYDSIYNYFFAEGEYEKGLKEGLWKYYFPNLQLEQEGYFTADNPDREWIWYYSDGKIRKEENYLNGKLEGHYKEYDKNGNIIAEGEYFDNERNGEWNLTIGITKQKGKYEYGELNGKWEMHYLNKNKYFEGNFRNGDPIGRQYWFYPDGNIFISGEYRAGKKHGEWKVFNLDNSISKTYVYKNGNIIKIDGEKILEEIE